MSSKSAKILVDADSCPVKQEIYKVAARHQIGVLLVSNAYFKIPEHPLFESVIVGSDFDAADDYIAERASPLTVVITADILLADRCLKAGAKVVSPNGKPFTKDSIGTAIATRAIHEDLRASGEQVNGPAPFAKTDRSRFLSTLHLTLLKLSR